MENGGRRKNLSPDLGVKMCSPTMSYMLGLQVDKSDYRGIA